MKITHIVILFVLCGNARARLNSDGGVEQDERSLQNENDDLTDFAGKSVVNNAHQQASEPAGPPVSFQSFLVSDDDRPDAEQRNVLISYNNTNGQAKLEEGALKLNYKTEFVEGEYFVKANAKLCQEWASDPDLG
jgi:hypothetical protein